MARASQIITEFLAFDAEHFGGMADSWTSILKIAYTHLAQLRLSDILLALVDRTCMNRGTFQCGGLLDFIGFYGGVGNLSRELLLRHLHGAIFNTMYRPVDHDCLGQGFRLWLDALCSTCEGALVWLGTQCSLFVALCASVSKGRLENQWMGDNGREFVQVGNCHMIITALIYFLATLLQCATCLEQPLNSCLPKLPLDGQCPHLLQCNQGEHALGLIWGRDARAIANMDHLPRATGPVEAKARQSAWHPCFKRAKWSIHWIEGALGSIWHLHPCIWS